MKTTILTIILCLCGLVTTMAQEQTFNVELKGKEYKELQLVVYNTKGAKVRIDGQCSNQYDWTFVMPDSLYQVSKRFGLEIPTGLGNVDHYVSLYLLKAENDTVKQGQFHIAPSVNYVAKFLQTDDTIKGMAFFRGKDVLFDTFLMSEASPTEFTLAARDFDINRYDALNYGSKLEDYISAVAEFGDSHYLMHYLLENINDFEKEDAQRAFAYFSERMRNSHNGKEVERILTNKHFENIELVNPLSNKAECILEKDDKANLVVFSASWCGPCHKQIPLLKEMYNELKDKFNIVYVTIDDEKTIGAWNKLMQDEQILWRSVWVQGREKEVRDQYVVRAIPHTILVLPDATTEIVDVRKIVDKERVYELVK